MKNQTLLMIAIVFSGLLCSQAAFSQDEMVEGDTADPNVQAGVMVDINVAKIVAVGDDGTTEYTRIQDAIDDTKDDNDSWNLFSGIYVESKSSYVPSLSRYGYETPLCGR